MVILSHYQAKTLLVARQAGRDIVVVSPDLNLTLVEVTLDAQGVAFPNGEYVDWGKLEQIAKVRYKMLCA